MARDLIDKKIISLIRLTNTFKFYYDAKECAGEISLFSIPIITIYKISYVMYKHMSMCGDGH